MWGFDSYIYQSNTIYGMFRAVFHMNRMDGMTRDAFREYQLTTHVPIGTQLPNLRRYTLSFPVDPDAAPCDVVAELYFDSMADLEEAMASSEAAAAIADLENYVDLDSLVQFVVEEEPVFDRSADTPRSD